VCEAAAEIARTNPKLVIHTVGLGLEKTDADRMRCVAQQTGGQQFLASNEAEIATALKDAFQRAALDPGSAPPAPATPLAAAPAATPQGPPGLRLTATLSSGGAMLQAPIAWRIADAKAGANTAPLVERQSAEINEQLPPGRYAVTVSHGLVTRAVELDVGDAGPTIHRVDLDAGTIDVSATASKLGDKLNAPVATITPLGAGDAAGAAPLWIGREATVQKIVPAGRYDVAIADGLARSATRLDVASGASASASLVLETGRLELTAAAFDGGPAAQDVTFILAVDDADAPMGRREIARSAAPAPQFTLQAGTYYATARVGANEIRERVAISSGDIVKRTLTLNIAKLTVKPSLDGPAPAGGLPIITRIWQGDGDKRLLAHSTDPAPSFVLGAGRYKIETQVGTLNVRATELLDLAAGRDQTISPKLQTGEIAIAGATGAGLRAVIRDAKGRTIWRSRQGTALKAVVAPGDYVVSIENGQSEVLQPVSVKPGETRSVGLAAP
jgi:Ca-activated chloride channel family protein